ncbi:hypothetical protein Hypma_013533 [Hypsizygus marmoreus]|uniref:Uncharacterized protein n=1 Tax=Hypsizygus marmoreus TaxID=39966 RepID=A0A369JIL0_HYPMA|nr:hypothetical protein Hypma_013533 [Hypsizygus marmoreus]
MAPTLAPYSAAYINTLPIQVAALVAFEQHNASEAVYGPLQDVFAKHSATKFGLRVIHKLVATSPSPEGPPADQKAATAAEQVLKDSDRIIRSNNVALVVDINALSQEALDKLVPITWGFKDDSSIFPLEFALSADPAKDQLTSADLAFFADVQSVLAGKPYASIVGISLVAYQAVGVKVTRGPVSVTLPFELVDLFEGDTRRETAWGFVDGELQVQGLICVTRGAQSYATSVYGGYYGYGDRCNSWRNIYVTDQCYPL